MGGAGVQGLAQHMPVGMPACQLQLWQGNSVASLAGFQAPSAQFRILGWW
jgi:hypothetical protein